MEKIISEIQTHFASQIQGLRLLTSVGNTYKAYSFRQGVEYGVAIETSSTKEILKRLHKLQSRRLTT